MASIFTGYSIVIYYNIVLAWALVYFIYSFASPLHWGNEYMGEHSEDYIDYCAGWHSSARFFYVDHLEAYDDNC